MSKKELSEQDIRTKYITPAIIASDWDLHTQIREEVTFTAGRIIVRGKLYSRGKAKRADYVLYHKPNQPIAIVEAKDNKHSFGDGMQQALDYAEALDVPFAFSSNELLTGYKALLADVATTRELLKQKLMSALEKGGTT